MDFDNNTAFNLICIQSLLFIWKMICMPMDTIGNTFHFYFFHREPYNLTVKLNFDSCISFTVTHIYKLLFNAYNIPNTSFA